MWQEIQDMPGEIFDLDIPELKDEEKFNMNEYLNGDYDYWSDRICCPSLSLPPCSLLKNLTQTSLTFEEIDALLKFIEFHTDSFSDEESAEELNELVGCDVDALYNKLSEMQDEVWWQLIEHNSSKITFNKSLMGWILKQWSVSFMTLWKTIWCRILMKNWSKKLKNTTQSF